MRDAFGEIDPDEIDVIDFVEFDTNAFAEDDEFDVPTPSNWRRWVVPVAITAAVCLAAAGLLMWSPWREDHTLSFPDGETPELTLTEELVFDDPPLPLSSASLGRTSEDLGVEPTEFEGYIFAEPGASMDLDGQSTGRLALFFAADSGRTPDPTGFEGATTGTVQGARAVISPGPATQLRIEFGPVDGRRFTVVTGGMSRAESLAFAEAVGVDDGVAILTDGRVLGTMEPVGDVADLDVATVTFFHAVFPSLESLGTVSVHYGDFDFEFMGNGGVAYSLASQAVVGSTTLATLQFLFNGENGHLVHGQPAVAVDLASAMLGANQANSVVAWVEGGRLIVVAGPDDINATLALAETVRPATDDEWAQVVAAAQNQVAPSIPLFPDTTSVDFGEDVTLYEDVDPATGDTFSFSVQIRDGDLLTCIHEQSAAGSTGECGVEEPGGVELPLLWAGNRTGHRLVLAIVERGLGEDAELRVTLADGTIAAFPLVEVSSDLPGPAVATVLPVGHGTVELWVGEKVVRTL